MLLQVIDGQGILQTVIATGQETVVDHSGSLDSSAAQELLAENESRSGWFIQNRGTNPMYLNELGEDASATVAADSGSIKLAAGESFPPAGYPVTTAAISIIGTVDDDFICREW